MPSFCFLVPSFCFCTLIPVFCTVVPNIRQNHPFGNNPLASPRLPASLPPLRCLISQKIPAPTKIKLALPPPPANPKDHPPPPKTNFMGMEVSCRKNAKLPGAQIGATISGPRSEKVFVSQERVSGFPEKGADLREVWGTSGEVWGTSGEVWETSGEPLDCC